jgi:hypothetical protein
MLRMLIALRLVTGAAARVPTVEIGYARLSDPVRTAMAALSYVAA